MTFVKIHFQKHSHGNVSDLGSQWPDNYHMSITWKVHAVNNLVSYHSKYTLRAYVWIFGCFSIKWLHVQFAWGNPKKISALPDQYNK